MFVSPELQYHVEDSSLSTPDELWTKLEVLFRIKEYCEECMQEIDKTKPTENPLEEQASQFEETLHASGATCRDFYTGICTSFCSIHSR
jgi:hypothetical protein